METTPMQGLTYGHGQGRWRRALRLTATIASAIAAAMAAAGCRCGAAAAGGDLLEARATSGGNTIYTWATPAGGFASSTDLAAVPEDARTHVMIEDLAAPPGDGSTVVVADLRGVLEGNAVKARRLDRATFESFARAAVAAATPPTVPATATTLSSGFGTGAAGVGAGVAPATGVVMYSASWCGVCASARKYFSARGVPFVEKDVEKDAGARDELLAKARAAGMAYKGGVPVLDIGGRLLVGFDQRVVENLLKATGLLAG
jgi:glutaredoxin 3